MNVKKIANESESVQIINSIVMNVTEDCVESSVGSIISLLQPNFTKLIPRFVSCYLTAIKYRIKQFNALFSMLLMLDSKKEEYANISSLIPNLMSKIFSPKFFKEQSLFLAAKLLEKEMISKIDLVQYIRKFAFKQPKNHLEFYFYICWFGYELEIVHRYFYNSLVRKINKAMKEELNYYIYQYPETNKFLRANNWAKSRELRAIGHNLTPVHEAIINDDADKLQKLSQEIKFDFDQTISPSIFEIHDILQFYPTLLDAAAYYGSINCFKFLLLSGANVFLEDKNHLTVAHFTIAGGDVEIIRILEQQYQCLFRGTLQISARYQWNDIFYWLVNKEDIDENVENFGTAIQNCAYSNNIEIANFCLEKKVDINSGDLNMTSLMTAVQYQNIEIAALLVSQPFVAANWKRWDGDALCIACQVGNRRIVKLLLAYKGLDLNVSSPFKGSPIVCAAKNGYSKIVKLLLDTGKIDLTISSKEGNALHVAVSNHHYECAKLLLDAGIDVNEKINGVSPIYIAAKNNDPEIVRLLLSQKGIDVNAETQGKFTPLFVSARAGYIDVVRLLTNHQNINLNVKNVLN